MDGKIDGTDLRNTVDDLIWVVSCMADMPDQLIGGKHAQDNEPDTSVKKRYVLSFPITSQADGTNTAGGN